MVDMPLNKETKPNKCFHARINSVWIFIRASHQSGFDTRPFLSWGFRGGGGGGGGAKIHALLNNVGHRITRCNVNYERLC